MFIILTEEDGKKLAINTNKITRVYAFKSSISIWDSEDTSVSIPGMTLEEFVSLVNYAKDK